MELDPNPLAAYSFCYERIFGAFLSPLSPMPILRNQPKKPLPPACVHTKGPSRKDVRGQGEGGSAQSGQSKGTYVVTVTSYLGQGGEGVKKSRFSADVLSGWPLSKLQPRVNAELSSIMEKLFPINQSVKK